MLLRQTGMWRWLEIYNRLDILCVTKIADVICKTGLFQRIPKAIFSIDADFIVLFEKSCS